MLFAVTVVFHNVNVPDSAAGSAADIWNELRSSPEFIWRVVWFWTVDVDGFELAENVGVQFTGCFDTEFQCKFQCPITGCCSQFDGEFRGEIGRKKEEKEEAEPR